MRAPGLKLGLLGGTFNPVHFGHLRAAEEVAESFGLDRFLFVPASHPPHKDPSPVIDFVHRLEMVRLATGSRPGFHVSDIEGRRTGPSYTVETLEAFHREYGPRLNIYFLTGLEAFLEIHTWKDYGKLFKLAYFVVINRSGSVPEQLNPYLRDRVAASYVWNSRRQAYISPNRPPIYFQVVTRLDISSSDIRTRLSRGESIRYLIPDRVREYILANRLYENKNPKEKGRICG